MYVIKVTYICSVIIKALHMNSLISNTRAGNIARNINAMDIYYEYCDNMKTYKFWSSLKKKLDTILESLTDADRKIVTSLCEADKREYFKLI